MIYSTIITNKNISVMNYNITMLLIFKTLFYLYTILYNIY